MSQSDPPTSINPMHSQPHSSGNRQQGEDERQTLSAATDGDADALGKALGAWRADPSTRATWHAYHLIGDVLRSNELAAAPGRDEAFLQQLRAKLALEPVVLAPKPLSAAKRRAAAWLLPSALAAGLAVVGGAVLVVARLSAPPSDDRLAAVAGPSEVRVGALSAAPSPSPGQASMLRNPRLDEFLRAHQAAHGGMAVPGSGLYRAAVELPSGTPQ